MLGGRNLALREMLVQDGLCPIQRHGPSVFQACVPHDLENKAISPMGEQLQTLACLQVSRKEIWFHLHSQSSDPIGVGRA